MGVQILSRTNPARNLALISWAVFEIECTQTYIHTYKHTNIHTYIHTDATESPTHNPTIVGVGNDHSNELKGMPKHTWAHTPLFFSHDKVAAHSFEWHVLCIRKGVYMVNLNGLVTPTFWMLVWMHSTLQISKLDLSSWLTTVHQVATIHVCIFHTWKQISAMAWKSVVTTSSNYSVTLFSRQKNVYSLIHTCTLLNLNIYYLRKRCIIF